FLVDRRYLVLRDDLKLAGRTLFGTMSSKGQELEDHYFGSIGSRVLSFMAEVEKRMFSLGIPARTRHNEVAPAQFELAPMYERANLATDHNMLTMEVLRSTAERHGLVCLLHEKPFAGINGSGKHNNWSLCDSDGNNLLDPGSTPLDNAQFLVFLAAVLRAVHKNPIVLRLGTIGAGNDHRLGANEAPPAILSIFLGEQLCSIIDSIALGKNNGKGDASGWVAGEIKVGVSTLPPLSKDVTDRNRTSPFAFTGNKFEFRAVGSSQSIAPANIALNTAMADALDDIATELEASLAKGESLAKAAQTLLAKFFKEHRNIVFNGNGYSEEWTKEAAKRGLPNLKDTVSVLEHHSDKEVMAVFLRQGVFSERELLARQEVMLENYIRDVHVETKLVSHIGRSIILPAALSWLKKLGELAITSKALVVKTDAKKILPEEEYFNRVREQVVGLLAALDALDKKHVEVDNLKGIEVRSEASRNELIPLMAKCREYADSLEKLVDDLMWPLPTYNEMLWQL
ncbi:MAG: glutamine synthetase type III, partial [Deltaproteobacteria bacterium]|nr:glutamine synthetase type III [Deltaproteobacteria bacterium]